MRYTAQGWEKSSRRRTGQSQIVISMKKQITRNQAGRIIRMIRKGYREFTFTILLQTKQYRSHYHHRPLRIFTPNGLDLKSNQPGEEA